MRKVWLTKDQLIPKPFYKRKLFIFFIIVFIFGIVFIIYQFKFLEQLQISDMKNDENRIHLRDLVLTKKKEPAAALARTKRELIKGIRIRDIDFYTQKFPNQLFKCMETKDPAVWIPFELVNDDYCDCPDGSDETFTNACANGKFYCLKQTRHITGRGKDVFVPTSRVNDGICDCEDCSDEFN